MKHEHTIADLHRSLDDSLLVHHIAVPLEKCKSNEDAKEVQKRMKQNKFDVMGVAENGRTVGYVRQEEMNAKKCGDHYRQFGPDDLISSTTPLKDALRLFQFKAHIFVLERTSISHLVTISDLQKAPMRMLLFGLASLLEMYLLKMVRICYPNESYVKPLADRLSAVKGRFAKRVKRNEEIDLADCLTLFDKYELLLKVGGFSDFFSFVSVQEAGRSFQGMVKMRDALAHGQDLVAGTKWDEVIRTAIRLEDFLKTYDLNEDKFRRRFGSGSQKG